MLKTQKKYFSDALGTLAHLLLCEVKTLTINLNLNHENKAQICSIPTREQSVIQLHSLFPQAYLQPKEGVFSNFLCHLMDQRDIYAIQHQRGV